MAKTLEPPIIGGEDSGRRVEQAAEPITVREKRRDRPRNRYHEHGRHRGGDGGTQSAGAMQP
jgi:hypothetical protein